MQEEEKIEVYFVCSNEDRPIKVCLSKESAFATKADFVDSFNAEGDLVTTYVTELGTDDEYILLEDF